MEQTTVCTFKFTSFPDEDVVPRSIGILFVLLHIAGTTWTWLDAKAARLSPFLICMDRWGQTYNFIELHSGVTQRGNIQTWISWFNCTKALEPTRFVWITRLHELSLWVLQRPGLSIQHYQVQRFYCVWMRLYQFSTTSVLSETFKSLLTNVLDKCSRGRMPYFDSLCHFNALLTNQNSGFN